MRVESARFAEGETLAQIANPAPRAPRRLLAPALLCGLYALVALGVYAPSLRGPFLSDDSIYLPQNPYVQRAALEDWIAIWSPTSALPGMVENYAPVHLTLHAVQWQLFGEATPGYHVTNVLVHALACALFVALLRRYGVGEIASALAGAFLLLHPANVEAVAWISQLKSSAALVFALLALLAFPRRGGLSTLCFALALLTKPTAAFALPVALWWRFGVRSAEAPAGRGRARRDALWLGAWSAVLVAFFVAEFAAFHATAGHLALRYPDLATRLRTVCALAARYLVMSASGLGTSAFHEPAPVGSWGDPWWLASLALLLALGARLAGTLRRRTREAGYWIWAAASFAPISQIVPFLYPMADRYLYFILPGLVGGVLLAGREIVSTRFGVAGPPASARTAVLLATLALLAFFAVGSADRARIWSSPALVVADAARHYPDGVSAKQLAAKRLAQAGDVAGAVASLRAAYARGWNRFEALLLDPGYAPLRADPGFRALVAEMASFWIERIDALPAPSQTELYFCAQAHVARGETAEAIALLERAARLPGPALAAVQRDLAALRARGGPAR